MDSAPLDVECFERALHDGERLGRFGLGLRARVGADR